MSFNPMPAASQARRTRAFSLNDEGTLETVWTDHLSSCNRWAPQSRAIVVVAPHPDDEILGAGGLIHACALEAREVCVVSVTDGEAAYGPGGGLGPVRRLELLNALRCVSPVHIETERLGIPDGNVRTHINRVRSAIASRLTDSCTLVAPYEEDGHPDHDAVGRVCVELAAVRGVEIARYPVWTWHHAHPSELENCRWGIFPLSASARRAKARAVQCFGSQLRPPEGDPILPPHVIAHFERPFEAFLL